MITIREYIRPATLEEAWALNQKRTSRVLGGMLWLKMQQGAAGTAIDLSGLGLDTIEETPEEFTAGAMVSLRALETNEALNAYTNGAAREALRHIVGVQFRNTATLGGSVYGRFGFSDLCTLFLALGAEAVLYRGGAVPLETFLKTPRHGERDILLSIRIPDDGRRVAFEAFRRTATDLAVLNTAVCRSSENTWRVAVGARPAVAALALRAGELLSLGDDPAQAARTAAQELRCGDNLRGSGEYRRALCEVLTARCVEQLTSMEPNGWRRTAE